MTKFKNDKLSPNSATLYFTKYSVW